jgi:hypothetical protein
VNAFPGIRTHEDGVEIDLKVVPGASRDEVAGTLGDRIKVRTNAPPEGGKANKAIAKLLAKALGVPTRDVVLSTGASSPEKTVRVSGVDSTTAHQVLCKA